MDFHQLNPLKQQLFLWAKDQDAARCCLALHRTADDSVSLHSLEGYFTDLAWWQRVRTAQAQGFEIAALVREGRIQPLCGAPAARIERVREVFNTWISEKDGTE